MLMQLRETQQLERMMFMELKQLKDRYSVKKFDPEKKLSEAQIQLLVDAFRLCPSSINIQPWRLVVVADEQKKAMLATAGKDTNADRIRECSHLLVLVRRPVTLSHCKRVVSETPIFQRIVERMKISNGKLAAYFWYSSKKSGGRHWASNQVYLALGFLLATCASAGIGALPMEGIKHRKMDKLLQLASGERTVVALAVGFPHADDADNPSRLSKARFPENEVVTII